VLGNRHASQCGKENSALNLKQAGALPHRPFLWLVPGKEPQVGVKGEQKKLKNQNQFPR
jgi:hypothetical protein